MDQRGSSLMCVIDASVTLSWVYTDEHSAASDSLLARVADQGAVVPSLWRLEIASALQTGIKRKRIDATYRDAAIQKLLSLPIETDPDTNDFAWTTPLQLADVHQITVYDASYLELALRRGMPLATRDDQLAAAASSAGVILLPTRCIRLALFPPVVLSLRFFFIFCLSPLRRIILVRPCLLFLALTLIAPLPFRRKIAS